MKFFLDTASLKDISWAAQAGLIDGVTTNPSLLAKQAGDLDPRDVLKEICSLVDGPVPRGAGGRGPAAWWGGAAGPPKTPAKTAAKIPWTGAGMVPLRAPPPGGSRP